MIKSGRSHGFIPLFIALLLTAPAPAQQAKPGQVVPVIGYAFPAGGCQKSEFEVAVGGFALTGTTQAVFSGQGISAVVLKHYKPINNQLQNKIRDLLKAEREKRAKPAATGSAKKPARPFKSGTYVRDEDLLRSIAEREGITPAQVDAYLEAVEQKRDPKRQINVQLSERITLRVKIDPAAPVGKRELRLLSGNGLSNPVAFIVGTLPELTETEPNDRAEQVAAKPVALPAVLNGRILPGDVDCFSFEARKGMNLTVAVAARELTPYLADAVPGWFQATVMLQDASGHEVAYKGSFAHRPDPLLCVNLPADGRYVLQIRDSICRGREDFVYRITAGEMPCLTEQFPTGGQVGAKVPVRVAGWNLPDYETTIEVGDTPGSRLIAPKPPILGFVQFEAGRFPEVFETPPENSAGKPLELKFPSTVNAIINTPAEHDRYAVQLAANTAVVAEIRARRLGSPLDSLLRVTGPDGKEIAANDDHDDPAAGLLTHHADSRVTFTAATAGIYHFQVTDAQGKGSRAHTYRLTIAPPQPGFELRIVPSCLNGRPGSMATFTAHVLRRDGFAGEIDLSLRDAPPGYELLGTKLPADKESVQLSLKLPYNAAAGVFPLAIDGTARVGDQQLVSKAVPAEDRMQAFFYRHLVPAEQLLACVTSAPRSFNRGQAMFAAMNQFRPLCAAGLTIPAGGSATLSLPGLNRPAAPQKLKFALAAPPPGLALTTAVNGNQTVLTFTADPALVKPGNLGNLIVNVFAQGQGRPQNPNPKQKAQPVKVGTLPPIPCRIAPAVAAGSK
jgi:hypothetical protein